MIVKRIDIPKKELEDMQKWMDKTTPLNFWADKELIRLLEKDPTSMKLLANGRVLDNLVQSNQILLMLPGITPNYPYSDGGAYVKTMPNGDKILKGLTTYKGKSPFTYTLADLVGEKESKGKTRIIQFNYPNDEDFSKCFNILNYYISDYLNIQLEGGIEGKDFTVYGSSLGGKTAIYTAGKILEHGGNLENLILYAPAISSDLLVPPINLLDKVPGYFAAAFEKLGLTIVDWQIRNSWKKGWWVELSKEDLQKLGKAVGGYDLTWKTLKERLAFIAKNPKYDLEFQKYLKLINESGTNIIVLTSDIGNGTDGVLINKKIEEEIKLLFPELSIKFVNVEGLPHVNVPQAAIKHAKIIKANL